MSRVLNQNETEIVGPLFAEAFENPDEVIESFISNRGAVNAESDPFVASLINGQRAILTGVRGTGKTMIMVTAEAILKKRCKSGNLTFLPSFISFAGFRADVSLQEEIELSPDEVVKAREIFRGYFFMTLLHEILEVVESLELDQSITFNWFGLRTRFGVKREVKKAIQQFRRLGFRDIVKSKEAGLDITVAVEALATEFGPNFGVSTETKEVSLNDMQKTALFKETVEGICEAYGIGKIYFLFDEVHYLKFLQSEFFDILFGFRNEPKISFSISAYPTYMDYGGSFDIPDDARDMSISPTLYKPTKKDFDESLLKLLELRISKYGKKKVDEVITTDAAEQLFLLCNGNPRILLQAIDYIWKRNAHKKINLSSITNENVSEMVNVYYLDFMKNQAKRYKTNVGKAQSFLNVVIDRLREYNHRNEVATSFFLISDEIIEQYSDTINLLVYSRIIDKIRISSFGGSINRKGILYLLNPMVAIYYGVFSSQAQINRLSTHIKDSLDKDKKVQFGSPSSFTNQNGEIELSCPRFVDNTCPEPKCLKFYSEQWVTCPFHIGISLEQRLPQTNEVFIEVLGLTTRMITRLKDAKIRTLKDIFDADLEGLREINQIGPIRSRNIYFLAKEYVDDNL